MTLAIFGKSSLHYHLGMVMRLDREARNYWKQHRRQMQRRTRRGRYGLLGDTPITIILIALMIISWIAERFVPGAIAALEVRPGGQILAYALAVIFPGSLLGLVFDGLFVWFIGSSIEPLIQWWQYLLVFVGSALIAAVILDRTTGAYAISSSLAAYGLAGAYVRVMMTRGIGGAARWALTLLLFNLVLSGFNDAIMIGIVSAFGSGFGIAVATGLDR